MSDERNPIADLALLLEHHERTSGIGPLPQGATLSPGQSEAIGSPSSKSVSQTSGGQGSPAELARLDFERALLECERKIAEAQQASKRATSNMSVSRGGLERAESEMRDAAAAEKWGEALRLLEDAEMQCRWVMRGVRADAGIGPARINIDRVQKEAAAVNTRNCSPILRQLEANWAKLPEYISGEEWDEVEYFLGRIDSGCSEIDREVAQYNRARAQWEKLDLGAILARISTGEKESADYLRRDMMEAFQTAPVARARGCLDDARMAAADGRFIDAINQYRWAGQHMDDFGQEVKRTVKAMKIAKLKPEDLETATSAGKCAALRTLRAQPVPENSRMFKIQAKLLASMKMEPAFKAKQEEFMKKLAEPLANSLRSAKQDWSNSEKMPQAAKLKAMQDLAATLAVYFEMDPPPVGLEDMGPPRTGAMGTSGASGITINTHPENTCLNDFAATVNTIVHETMHAWQRALVRGGASSSMKAKVGVTDAQIDMFRLNSSEAGNLSVYVSSKTARERLGDSSAYKKQPLEEHAYHFGEMMSREIMQRLMGAFEAMGKWLSE